jgi:hypothetical protein
MSGSVASAWHVDQAASRHRAIADLVDGGVDLLQRKAVGDQLTQLETAVAEQVLVTRDVRLLNFGQCAETGGAPEHDALDRQSAYSACVILRADLVQEAIVRAE